MRSGPLVVVGDALLDVDVTGHAERLMPDAPAPVVDDAEECFRPGGAALAATLAASSSTSSGREVVLITALADDEPAARLRSLCTAHGVRVVAIPHDGSTVVKRRVLADGRPLGRLDTGGCGRLGALPGEAAEVLRSAAAVLVADYGNGVTAAPQVRRLLAELTPRTPLVWDPHPRGAEPVAGARLVTPNEAEATRLATAGGPADDRGRSRLGRVSRIAADLVTRWQAQAVVVTLGSAGAVLSRGEPTPAVLPAPQVRGDDTCGAGDRFSSAAASALADGALVPEAVEEAVAAAAEFVAAGGARSVGGTPAAGPEPAAGRRGTLVATGGCFDLLHAGHVATLEAARALGDRLVVCLNSDASVRRLKGPARPIVPQADRARVLEALGCVDEVVVFDEDTPADTIARLRPDVWVKGGDYAGTTLPEAELLQQWGGQAVVVPYVQGRSTTSLVATARATAG